MVSEAVVTLYKKVGELLHENQGDNWLANQGWLGIANYTQEEVYELIDAIMQQDFSSIEDELADLLFHLLIYVHRGDDEGHFTLETVALRSLSKLMDRYQQKEGDAASHAHWQLQKLKTKWETTGSVVADVPAKLPAILQARKIQSLKAVLGLSTKPSSDEWLSSIVNQCQSLSQLTTLESQEKDRRVGELLFSIINYAQDQGVHAEQTLRHINQEQYQRLIRYEAKVEAAGYHPLECDPAQRDYFWNQLEE